MTYNKFAGQFVNALTGKNKNIDKPEIIIPSIQEMLNNLIKISDEDWGRYGFRREPLKGRFNDEERLRLIIKANACGREKAQEIREEYGSIDTYKIAEKMNLKVDYPDRPNGGGHIIFAQFVEPNQITIFKDSIDKALKLIEEEKISDLFSNINIEELLLAHEIFHYIEENDSNIFTRSETIRLWKIGPFKNDSGIVALGEIAGMAFAKELLQISYSPYILDVFLVYLYNKEAGYALYNEIMGISNSL